MKNVIELLKKAEGINGWRVTESATKSYELFFVHEALETVRSTDTVDTEVTVYVEHDGFLGDSGFNVYRSMTDEDIAKKIATAAKRAGLVYNQPYVLPEKAEFKAELKSDMNDIGNFADYAQKIADAVFNAKAPAGGSINALEVFVYKKTLHVINSNGLDKEQVGYSAFVEAIPTFTTEKLSVEIYESMRFTDLNAEKIAKEIAEKLADTKARYEAKKPTTPMTVNVLLRPHEIGQLMSDIAYDLNYTSVYMRANLRKVGEDIQEGGNGDKIDLTMCAVVEGSDASRYFDADGTKLTDTKLIEGGVVKANYGGHRFGQYLGVKEPSGNLPCKVLGKGTLTEKELEKEPYLECVALSGLQVDLYNDYIGGEIRTAYYCDGKKKTPVTGVTMSAKLSDVLKTMRLYDDCDVNGSYKGPTRMLMKNVTVL
ncbi:MAG: hypothetical protein J5762_00125 [Clostridia bacterium]|nr:hypothetical protein [Clostridia bacterium]